MINRKLLKLIDNHKHIIFTVILMVCGLITNIVITGSLVYLIKEVANHSDDSSVWTYLWPALIAIISIIIRYLLSISVGYLKDIIGRQAKKDLRQKVYNKIVRLGVRTTDGMKVAGLTQVSLEGVEQLDLYYSTYIPQFFYALLAPIILFFVTVWFDWRFSLVLLAAVPLIPLSIIAISKYAKRIFAKYWGKYTAMGDKFLDSIQGLRELKIFKADAYQQTKMNEASEEFRVITMKVLVMQLASTTIMDIVAYTGAGIGVLIAIISVLKWGLSPFSALFLILVAVEFFLPLRALGSAFHVAMNGASAGQKILSLLAEEETPWGTKEVTNANIEIKDVTFAYNGHANVLNDVSMTFKEQGYGFDCW